MFSLQQTLRLPTALRAATVIGHIHTRHLSSENRFFKVSEEVRQALSERRPVVALESTIYTHGFPYPDNVHLASHLESLVRLHAGVPATIGVLDGIARVGFSAAELVRLAASAKDHATGALKISRRDLAFALGLRDASNKPLNGGTTVSATMLLAHVAGIRVFATGGLGGVHRGAAETLDISADLTELGRTPIAVISSGCKAFLDIPKTLEYLETQGVGVATFADRRPSGEVEFPAFWSRGSGYKSPAVVRDAAEAAKVVHAQFTGLGLISGLLFANPIPAEHEIPFTQMRDAISQAIDAAERDGATGARSTPYILAKIKELTASRSVVANKSLVENNVIMGTEVAKQFSRLESDEFAEPKKQDEPSGHIISPRAATSDGALKGGAPIPAPQQRQSTQPTASSPSKMDQRSRVFVAGALNIDFTCDYQAKSSNTGDSQPELHTSNPARIAQSLGGVGHNVARAAQLMGTSVRLCSVVGDDLSGKAALDALADEGLSDAGVKVLGTGRRTSQYIAINDASKDLVVAMADMSIFEAPAPGSQDLDAIAEAFETLWLPQLLDSNPSHLFLDANWPPDYLGRWLEAGKEENAHIIFEPVSNIKAGRLFDLTLTCFPNPSLHLTTPNATELTALYNAARKNNFFERDDWWRVIDALGIPSSGARTKLALATSNDLVDQGFAQQSIQLLPFIPSICTKLGPKGVLVTQLLAAGDERLMSEEDAPYILSRNPLEGNLGVGGVYMRLFPAVSDLEPWDIVSVNGAGDTFAGVLVACLAAAHEKAVVARLEDFVNLAQEAAVVSLKSEGAVGDRVGKFRTSWPPRG